jgi:hypothetical protein
VSIPTRRAYKGTGTDAASKIEAFEDAWTRNQESQKVLEEWIESWRTCQRHA